MEDLTKQQMVLLTLLVSFVTSIATGIVTVALLAEAPPEVPQTVNRIIERTIERVVPEESTSTPRIETITKEVTVTVKEDDLLTSAVEKNIAKIATVYPEGVGSSTRSMGIATLLSRDGVMIADRNSLIVEGAFLSKYIVVFPDGTTADAEILGRETYKDTNLEPIAFLKLVDTEGIPSPVTWVSPGDVKLGQTIAVVGGVDGSEAFKTSVSRLNKGTTGEGTSSVQFIASVETNPVLGNLFRGSSVFNLDGNVIGFVIRRVEEGNVILPIRRIVEILTDIQKAMKEAEKPSGSTSVLTDPILVPTAS